MLLARKYHKNIHVKLFILENIHIWIHFGSDFVDFYFSGCIKRTTTAIFNLYSIFYKQRW